jgi:hypothetical protein
MTHHNQCQEPPSPALFEELKLIAQSAGEAALARILEAGEGVTIIEIDGEEYEVTLKRTAPEQKRSWH